MISFIASLPPIPTAITLDGQGDGAKVKLDIPRSEIKAILQLQSLTETIFKVTIEEVKIKNG